MKDVTETSRFYDYWRKNPGAIKWYKSWSFTQEKMQELSRMLVWDTKSLSEISKENRGWLKPGKTSNMHLIDYRKFHLCGYLLEKFDDLMCAPDNTSDASESIGFECFFRKREQKN
jgi:hypothetical protein